MAGQVNNKPLLAAPHLADIDDGDDGDDGVGVGGGSIPVPASHPHPPAAAAAAAATGESSATSSLSAESTLSTTTEINQSQFKCSRCCRVYTRSDHLTRHFRSHTQEKPFACPVCGKSFARADLLKRHALNHEGVLDASPSKRACKQLSSIISSKRAAQACKSCAIAKVRCDGENPCHRCIKRQVLCEYGSNDRRPRPTQSPISSTTSTSTASTTTATTNNTVMYAIPKRPHQNQMPISDEYAADDRTIAAANAHLNPSAGHPTPPSQLPTPSATEIFGEDPKINYPSLDDGNNNSQFMQQPNQFTQYAASFANFLKEIMIPDPSTAGPTWSVDTGPLVSMDPDPYGTRDLLDFDAGSLELNDGDFDALECFSKSLPPYPESLSSSSSSETTTTQMHASSSDHHCQTPDSSSINHMGMMPEPEEAPNPLPSQVEAFQESLWCWKPSSNDSYTDGPEITRTLDKIGNGEAFAAAGEQKLVSQINRYGGLSVTRRRRIATIGLAGRDRIQLMVVKSYDFWNASKMPTSFPRSQLLDILVDLFFNRQGVSAMKWLHWSTFDPSDSTGGYLAAVVAAGAVLAPPHCVKKFGYGLQEAIRRSLGPHFEGNNSLTRNLKTLQMFFISLSIGVWSGNKRKIELAESFRQCLITMLRRAGRFRSYPYYSITPLHEDDDETLNKKWKTWLDLESWKRLAYFTFILDAQISISFHVNPLVSYAELSLPLPYSEELWNASSARLWRGIFHAQPPPMRLPSFVECFRNFPSYFINDQSSLAPGIDQNLTLFLVLNAISALIREYRQLESVTRSSDEHAPMSAECNDPSLSVGFQTTSELFLSSRMQELSETLSHWRLASESMSSHRGPESIESEIMFELLQLSLYASLENVQIFAGKEGEVEARKIYPALLRWRRSDHSRRALWHAAQLIQISRKSRQYLILGDFSAVALYHASLVLWAYGLLSMNEYPDHPHSHSQNNNPHSHNQHQHQHQHQQQQHHHNSQQVLSYQKHHPHPHQQQQHNTHQNDRLLVPLDGEETPSTQRFIAHDRGEPCISSTSQLNSSSPPPPYESDGSSSYNNPNHHSNNNNNNNNNSGYGPNSNSMLIPLRSPRKVMNSLADLLRWEDEPTPLVESLSKLMRDLGNAAFAVGVRG